MGMFDDVNYECVCPVCHNKANGFQSKSGECLLDLVEPTEVDNFYTACQTCGCWISFTKKSEGVYERVVTGKGRDKALSEHTKDIKIGD